MSNLWSSDADSTDRWRQQVEAALRGTFVLERELRGGTMSRVFVGSETALGRHVVIKLLTPSAPGTDQEAEFRREAMIAARLHHPHIVPIFTVGTVTGIPYYTMPFIDGESLRARLDRGGALPLDPALRVLREIGAALEFAHELGVVHRDVKPENIVLERGTGRALLGDFGIACALGDSRRATPAGMTVGTPVYMSPEQVDGLELDGRTDIYSLGLVAWEMLAGVRPWSSTSLDDVMYRQKHVSLPPLSAYASHVPRPVVDAIERALRKKRDERWSSVGDFITALAAAPVPMAQHVNAPSRLPPLLSERRGTATSAPVADANGGEANPAAVPTLAMSARRAARWSNADPDAAFARTAFGSYAREDPRERRRQRLRWIVAACGALMVTGTLVAASFVHRGIVQLASQGHDLRSAAESPSVGESATVDRIPMPVAAGRLATVEAVTPILTTADSAPSSPLQAPTWHVAQSRIRPPAHANEDAQNSVDAVRARAATATLALEAYQSAVAGAPPPVHVPSPPAPDTAATDTGVPAVGVRVAPRRRATSDAATVTDSSSPAIGVPVHSPRTP